MSDLKAYGEHTFTLTLGQHATRWLADKMLRVDPTRGVFIDGKMVRYVASSSQELSVNEVTALMAEHVGHDQELPVLPFPFSGGQWLAFAERYQVVELWQSRSCARLNVQPPSDDGERHAEVEYKVDADEVARLRATSTQAADLVLALTRGSIELHSLVEAPLSGLEKEPSKDSTRGSAYWRVVLFGHIAMIDAAYDGHATAKQAIAFMKALKDDRILDEGSPVELKWRTDNGDRNRVIAKTVNNALNDARKAIRAR